ncbi:hypothetical protein ACUNHU_15990 [Serratia sp. IR-2025]|uniref:hypothetical protein n=1 Tax=Serratia marcescens TaxID=615 RepID=UPI003CFDB8DD
MKNNVEYQYIKIDNSDFTFLTNQKSWLKIPADGSPLTFTGNADDAAKEFFNALIRVRDGYISALKAERDAQQKRADALAVENENQRDWINKCSELWDAGCDLDNLLGLIPETRATDAALAAIRAQAVEDAVKQVLSVDTIASTAVISHLLRTYAAELREAK